MYKVCMHLFAKCKNYASILKDRKNRHLHTDVWNCIVIRSIPTNNHWKFQSLFEISSDC